MKLSLACPDWERKIVAGASLLPPGVFQINPTEGDRARKIFNKLRLPDVPGMPFLRDACGDWFREFTVAILGSLNEETGARDIREGFALVPKKNSKTSYGAGLMLTALLMNERPRAEFLLIGPTQAVANLAFDQAAGMCENDPDGFLQRRMHVQTHLKTIVNRDTRAELKIKTFDAKVLTGVKPAGVLVDELHEIAKNSGASRIIGQLRGGLLPIPEAFLIFITTQSDQPPAGVFKSELQTARSIRDGRQPGVMLPMLYEFPLSIARDKNHPPAWQRPENWPIVLPNLGRSITIERLIEDFDTAKEKGDEEIRRWASQHLNIEIGVGLHSDRWSGADYWEGCVDPSLTLDEVLRRSEVVCIGIDGGGLDDLLGLAVLGRDKETGDWLLWTHAWAHKIVFERRKEIAERLRDFEKQGDLTVIEKVGTEVSAVCDICERINQGGYLPEKNAIGLDSFGIGTYVRALKERGLTEEQIVGVRQGYQLNGTIATFGLRLAGEIVGSRLFHAGSELMNWCVGNVRTEIRGNAVLITKEAAGKAKIDPVCAALDAARVMEENTDPHERITEDYEIPIWA